MDSQVDDQQSPAQQKEHELAVRLLKLREKEISWMKQELHDRFGQLLFAIGANVKWTSEHCPPEADILSIRLRETLTLIEDAVQATRDFSSELRSDALHWGTLGLEEALSEYAAKLEEQWRLPIHFSSALLEEEALAPETASHLYGIVCEALTNAVRHAQATEVTITITRSQHELRISIKDNGTGFNLATHLSARTAGIEEMFARARLIDGELDVHTTPGGGTLVQLCAPLPDGKGQQR